MSSPLGPRATGVLTAAALAVLTLPAPAHAASGTFTDGAPGFTTTYAPPAWPSL